MNVEMRIGFEGMENFVGNATISLNFESVESMKILRDLQKCDK